MPLLLSLPLLRQGKTFSLEKSWTTEEITVFENKFLEKHKYALVVQS